MWRPTDRPAWLGCVCLVIFTLPPSTAGGVHPKRATTNAFFARNCFPFSPPVPSRQPCIWSVQKVQHITCSRRSRAWSANLYLYVFMHSRGVSRGMGRGRCNFLAAAARCISQLAVRENWPVYTVTVGVWSPNRRRRHGGFLLCFMGTTSCVGVFFFVLEMKKKYISTRHVCCEVKIG